MRATIAAAFLCLAACGPASENSSVDIARPDPLISGSVFLTPETRAMQADPFDNPSFLWVDLGERLFNQSEAGAPACSICHAPGGLTDTTATYPKIDHVSGELFNLEGRINACRTRHQGLDALDYESEPLLALTAYVARLSQGAPIAVSIEGAAAGHLARGREYFFTRRGQFNLACANCHDENWGKRLRGDTISQGHGNGFPAYGSNGRVSAPCIGGSAIAMRAFAPSLRHSVHRPISISSFISPPVRKGSKWNLQAFAGEASSRLLP